MVLGIIRDFYVSKSQFIVENLGFLSSKFIKIEIFIIFKKSFNSS